MQKCSPSEVGVDSGRIIAFLDAIEADSRIEPHGLIIQRRGRRIAEGYWAPHTKDHIRLVYSLSKTFTGTALALQLGEGRLTLDDLVSDHLPDLFAGADPTLRGLKIRHIASMATGHDRETLSEALAIDPDNPVRGFSTIPADQEPGTLFAYNQPPVIALAMILQRLAGERLTDYLRPRLLGPLGIHDLRWAQMQPGIDMGFSGVYTNLDAAARLGQLYLDNGVWNGAQLLPAGWVADAASVQIANPQRDEVDWRQGYGFQLWMSQHGYRGDGAFGQYMVVLPEFDAAIAMFSCTDAMQEVLDLMWEHLLPAFGDAPPALRFDDALAARLESLQLPTVASRLGGADSLVPDMSFAPGRIDAFSVSSISKIESIGGAESGVSRVVIHDGEDRLTVPLASKWTAVDDEVAGCATSLPDGRVAIDLAFLASPHRLAIELDPATGTFSTHWPSLPLFRAGFSPHLASMRAPN